MQALSEKLCERIRRLGFDAYGVVGLDAVGQNYGTALQNYIARNHHGTMDWMPGTAERRSHPNNLCQKRNRRWYWG